MFALIDCNNFYASCERVFRPDLNAKPIVVLSNNDGCIIARSNEAKKLGIQMGAPLYKYKTLIEANEVKTFSANFPLYGDLSSRVMNIISEYSLDTEIYSIDEAFLEIEDNELFLELGKKIKQKVLKWTGIPISIGFAKTKTLAKLANIIAKKYPDVTNGVHVIDTEQKLEKALKWAKLEDIWGIGKKTSKKLNSYNIYTAFQFIKQNDNWIQHTFSINVLKTKMELEEQVCIDTEDISDKKSIATTRSFEDYYFKYEQVKERIISFAVICAEKLRKQKSNCNAILVFLQTNRHRTDLPQYHKAISIKLPFSTNSSIEISKFALQALNHIFKEGYQYKKAGVVLMEFESEKNSQLSLFEKKNLKHQQLMQTIDELNAKMGQQKVRLAAQDNGSFWKMKQENLSPQYTTNIDDIIKVYCK